MALEKAKDLTFGKKAFDMRYMLLTLRVTLKSNVFSSHSKIFP